MIKSSTGLAAAVLAVIAVSGCGSATPTRNAGQAPPASAGPAAGNGSLSADATSGATGDIPDTQNFLTFRDRARGFSLVYPEGWTVQRLAAGVTFRDKNNLVRVAIGPGGPPTPTSVSGELARLSASDPTLKPTGRAQVLTLKSGPAVKASYTTQSAPNPVTNKRVTLMVDRYELAAGGRRATLELGTPVGVDNVDSYRRMANSFRWR